MRAGHGGVSRVGPLVLALASLAVLLPGPVWARQSELRAPARVGVPVGLGALGREQGVTQGGGNRRELETRILNRFVDIAAQQLQLDRGKKARLDALVKRGAAQRRVLARQAAQARRALTRAVQQGHTSDAQYNRLLARIDAIRSQEQDLESRETKELRTFLTPRQVAEFLVLRARLNQRIMRLMRDSGGAGGGR